MTSGSASAPASSANLGPGFDTIALALDLHCTVRATPADQWTITHGGTHPYKGDAADDAVLTAARRVSQRPMALEVDNAVPVSSGMGSSAAAFTAGALAALRAGGHDPDHDALFEIVRKLEGHPDNAAAAVYGGLVAVIEESVIHMTMSRELIPVIARPDVDLKTRDARRVLPEVYDTSVVARSLGRLAALIEGLRTGSRELLTLASGDELHERPRAELGPQVASIMSLARESGALHTCWSGAGPSVLSLANDEAHDAVVDALRAELGMDSVMVLAPDMLGAR